MYDNLLPWFADCVDKGGAKGRYALTCLRYTVAVVGFSRQDMCSMLLWDDGAEELVGGLIESIWDTESNTEECTCEWQLDMVVQASQMVQQLKTLDTDGSWLHSLVQYMAWPACLEEAGHEGCDHCVGQLIDV